MGKHKGRGSNKEPTEKELLEIENLKLQMRERRASIFSTIVITVIAVITAVINWFLGN